MTIKAIRNAAFILAVLGGILTLILCLVSIWAKPSVQEQWNATAGAVGVASMIVGGLGLWLAVMIYTVLDS